MTKNNEKWDEMLAGKSDDKRLSDVDMLYGDRNIGK